MCKGFHLENALQSENSLHKVLPSLERNKRVQVPSHRQGYLTRHNSVSSVAKQKTLNVKEYNAKRKNCSIKRGLIIYRVIGAVNQ